MKLKKLEQALKEFLKSDQLKSLAEKLAKEIFTRTKLGYGVNDHNQDQKRLAPLSDSYKKQRKYKALSSDTTPTKSNLTQSGDMLNDLQVLEAKNGNIKIGFQDALSKKKAQWNSEKGRTFMKLSKTQINQLKTLIKKEILTKAK